MPPLAIAAGIAAVGIGGSIISAHSANSAANQANQSQQQATQAQLQLGRENMAQQQAIYNSNYNTLSPFVSRGNVAGNSINALLGLPAAPAMTSPLATPTTPATTPAHPGGFQGGGGLLGGLIGSGLVHPAGQNGPLLRHDTVTHPGTTPTPAPAPAPAPAPTPAPGTTQPSATDAFNQFANSAGMQFQQQQAANGLNNLYAGHSQLQSGAAMKAIPAYLQQQALNNYFMPYMGLLGGQQSTGAQAGSAIAGVGSAFGNTASGIYNGMGNAIQGGADSASNAALLRGQNNSNMWNGIGSALGTFGSSFSDRRLKTNIKLIRRDADGLGWYDWNWKGDPNGAVQHGVIADEVAQLRPWAYVPNFRDGYDGVNYGALEAVNAG